MSDNKGGDAPTTFPGADNKIKNIGQAVESLQWQKKDEDDDEKWTWTTQAKTLMSPENKAVMTANNKLIDAVGYKKDNHMWTADAIEAMPWEETKANMVKVNAIEDGLFGHADFDNGEKVLDADGKVPEAAIALLPAYTRDIKAFNMYTELSANATDQACLEASKEVRSKIGKKVSGRKVSGDQFSPRYEQLFESKKRKRMEDVNNKVQAFLDGETD